jgi:hypothetical protein
MADLQTTADNLRAALAAHAPSRTVSRDLLDFDLRPATELAAGVYTVLLGGERDFVDYVGRVAQYGKLSITIVGQIQIAEDATSVAVQNAEFAMVEEIKAFARRLDLPAGVESLTVQSWASGQGIEAPFGWVALSLEAMGA